MSESTDMRGCRAPDGVIASHLTVSGLGVGCVTPMFERDGTASLSPEAFASHARSGSRSIAGVGRAIKVRAVVADDHPVYLEGIVRALSASGRVEIVGEADGGRTALATIQEHEPDVAVLDYKLPELDALDLTHAIKRDGLAARVLVVSAYTDSELVYRAFHEGASGYLSKDVRREQIVDGVLAVARGHQVLPPKLAEGVTDQIRLRAASQDTVLTARQRETLKLIAEGKSLPEIAKELHLGVTTVKTHVGLLYRKLGVSDRAAAVAVGMRCKLIE